MARQVKSFIKDTNDFLRKLSGIDNVPKDALLCTVDVVGLYPNIPHKDGLEALRGALETRKYKTVSTESLLELFWKTTFLNIMRKHLNRSRALL